jgi:hypothetical protein
VLSLGISGLRIEGQLDKPEAIAVVTQVYRRAIDSLRNGQTIDVADGLSTISAATNRSLSDGPFDFRSIQVADHSPAVRATGREEGVTCVACHLDQGALGGPLKPTGKVHPHPITVRPEVYRSRGICGRCHEGTLAQRESVNAEKQACQQCHMESITRKVTQATGGISNVLVAMEKQVPQRRHNFCILNDGQSQDLIALTIVSSGDSLDIFIENNLPHDLPTGDFGFRVVTLEVFGIDASGNSMLLGGWELAGEAATAILAHGTRTWSLNIGSSVRTVRAVLTRHSYDQETLMLAETQGEVAEP